MRRWCDYLLASHKHQDQQVVAKVYLSRRQFSRVLRCLNQLADPKALPFAVMCISSQLIDLQANHDMLVDIFDKFVTTFFGDYALRAAKGVASEDEKLDESVDETTITNLAYIWSLFKGEP